MDWFQISKTVIQYLWLTLGFVWLVAAFSVKRTSRTRSSGWRLLEIALAVVAFIVGFSRRFYSGFLLALIGTVIVFRQLRGLVALVVAFLTLLLKSRLEEQLMTEQFGAEYAEYSQRVKALIPFIY